MVERAHKFENGRVDGDLTSPMFYCVSQEKSLPALFSDIFPKWLGIFSPNFTRSDTPITCSYVR